MHVTFFFPPTYVKTKKREVEPTRRQAAVLTGMKALGFRESAPLAGILSSPHSSESHYWRKRPQRASAGLFLRLFLHERYIKKKRSQRRKIFKSSRSRSTAASRIQSVPAGSGARMPPTVYPKGGAFNLLTTRESPRLLLKRIGASSTRCPC